MELVKVVLIGEGMLELARRDGEWALGHGGDMLNTAIHLARYGMDTAFLTALGDDPYSAQLRMDWAAEGLDTGLILTDPDRNAGLYAISADAAGERTFTYWRSDSAARQMFALQQTAAALVLAEQADVLAFSLITLAILPPEARQVLLALCGRIRAHGGKVAFDGNYRPRLWPSAQAARSARDAALAFADIGLPTLDDEAALSGEAEGDAVAAHWQRHGCAEVIVKLGARGCRLPGGGVSAPPDVLAPVDTSGAGDAFNGGYLAARLRGASTEESALAGQRLAGWVVMRAGAIPARDQDAPYSC